MCQCGRAIDTDFVAPANDDMEHPMCDFCFAAFDETDPPLVEEPVPLHREGRGT